MLHQASESTFEGQVDPSEEAGSAVMGAVKRKEKELPNLSMVGEKEDKKEKKKKKKKKKHDSDSSDSSSEDEEAKKKKALKAAEEKQRKEQEKKEKEAVAAAKRNGAVEMKTLKKEAGAIHKKVVDLQMLVREVEGSKLAQHHKEETKKNLKICIDDLEKTERKIMLAETDEALIHLLTEHEEKITHADCEKNFVQGRLRELDKEKEKKAKKDKKGNKQDT
jgi:hypothetical protein